MRSREPVDTADFAIIKLSAEERKDGFPSRSKSCQNTKLASRTGYHDDIDASREHGRQYDHSIIRTNEQRYDNMLGNSRKTYNKMREDPVKRKTNQNRINKNGRNLKLQQKQNSESE